MLRIQYPEVAIPLCMSGFMDLFRVESASLLEMPFAFFSTNHVWPQTWESHMLLIKEEIFRGQLLSFLSLQYTDGEQHGACGETKYLKSEVSGGIGVYFHLGNCEISVLQYCAVQRSSQP